MKYDTEKITLFASVFLQVMSATGADSTGVYKNPPTEAPQVSMIVKFSMAAPYFQSVSLQGHFRVLLASPINSFGFW